MEHGDTVLVFFAYGLASFAMGLVIVVELRRAAPSPFATALRSFAAFGLLHGSAQWVLMAHLIKSGGVTVQGNDLMRGLFLALSALSAFALLRFAVQLVAPAGRRLRWVRWLPWALVGLWALFAFVPQTVATAREAPAGERRTCVDCHSEAARAYVTASRDRLNAADVGMHYVLVLPASVLAAAGFVRQGRRFRALGLPRLARETTGAAAACAAIAVVAGSIVPPAPYPPASVLNYATVFERIGFAPQVLWAIAAAALAVFVVRILGIFEFERRRQLQAAVIEERERIGREMHDGLAQGLGYVAMRTSLAEELLERGDVAAATDVVASIGAAADEAYRDVRAAILELRSSDVAQRGLRRCIEEYCDTFGAETGIAVEADVECAGHGHWSPLVELQLIRIVHEALANVRKHARAARAWVRLRCSGDACELSVADDGRGFSLADDGRGSAIDQAQRPGAHFGLATMRERAQSLGGALAIDTAPGRGTTVTVTVPHAMEAG